MPSWRKLAAWRRQLAAGTRLVRFAKNFGPNPAQCKLRIDLGGKSLSMNHNKARRLRGFCLSKIVGQQAAKAKILHCSQMKAVECAAVKISLVAVLAQSRPEQ